MPAAERTRWILILLLQGGGKQRYNAPIVGRTRLIKLLFLLKQAFGLRKMEYEFTPYWYGPFSPEILGDLEDLRDSGAIQALDSHGGETISLTPEGVRRAQDLEHASPSDDLRRIGECKERFNAMPFEELIAYVYERWPEFTARALRSPSNVLEELRKQARKARITDADVDRAVAEYRSQAS